MLGVPAPTAYDLRFGLFGIPVRINPWFWVMAAALGWGQPEQVIPWVACVFVSIMVHEFGHALTNRAFGVWPAVILHSFGGLCVSESGHTIRPWQRFLVIAAGPGAGFLLFGVTLTVYIALGGPRGDYSPLAGEIIYDLLQINLFWSILNLLPIFPLDGGQLAAILLEWRSPKGGLRHAFMISIVAGFGAALVFTKFGMYFQALLFGLLAFQNLQYLQASRYESPY